MYNVHVHCTLCWSPQIIVEKDISILIWSSLEMCSDIRTTFEFVNSQVTVS